MIYSNFYKPVNKHKVTYVISFVNFCVLLYPSCPECIHINIQLSAEFNLILHYI